MSPWVWHIGYRPPYHTIYITYSMDHNVYTMFCVSRCNVVNSFRGNTTQRKATGEKGPATELETRTDTLLQSFIHGLQVHATRCWMLSPLPSLDTVPASRCGFSSGRWIAEHLWTVHKAMEDEGFTAGTDGSCGCSSAKECRSQVRAQSLVLFLLSPSSIWAVFPRKLFT